MKVIVIKKIDGYISILHPELSKFGDEPGMRPFAEHPMLIPYVEQGAEWKVIDDTELPPIGSYEAKKQFYYEDGKIKVDTNWERNLMHALNIRGRLSKRLNEKLHIEMNSAKPSFQKISEIMIETQSLKDLTELELFEKALEIINDENIEKPVIVSKLKDKIAEYKGDVNLSQKKPGQPYKTIS